MLSVRILQDVKIAMLPAPHLLWGEWERGAWRDGQVPGDLNYPVPPDSVGRVQMRVQQYRDEKGVVAFGRYAGLVAQPGTQTPGLENGGE